MYLLLASIACSPREKKMPDVGLPLMQPRFLEFVIYLAVSLLLSRRSMLLTASYDLYPYSD